jgi:hypothetical protein
MIERTSAAAAVDGFGGKKGKPEVIKQFIVYLPGVRRIWPKVDLRTKQIV